MWSKFLITDGTKAGTIDLLPRLKEWAFSMPQTKGGGYWSGSTYTQGRQLFDKQLDNILDTFILDIFTGKQVTTIQWLNTLTTLLDKAVGYWTNDWQTEMVWIEICPEYQDNSQYAIIMDWNIPGLDEIFTAPFAFSGGMEDVNLIIEHGIWLAEEPATKTAVEIQSSNSLIDETTDDLSVWVTPYWSDYPLTHIFVYDAAPVTWTNITGLTGVNLFPAVPAIGDILYVGVQDTAPVVSGFFDNIIFNIGTAQVGLTILAEYSLGGGFWAALPVVGYAYTDNTNTFQNTGRNAIVFNPVDGVTPWGSDVVNGATAFWIRFRITNAVGAVTPTQVTDAIYTQQAPYFDISEDKIYGTYSSQAANKLLNQGRPTDFQAGGATNPIATDVIYGLRSLDRGEDFCAFLNATDTAALPPGVTWNLSAGVQQINRYSPVLYATRWSPAGVVAKPGTAIGYWKIVIPQSYEYVGRYRVFLRAYSFDQYFLYRVGIAIGTITSQIRQWSDWAYSSADAGVRVQQTFDMGIMEIPQPVSVQDDYSIFIWVYGAHENAAAVASQIYDIVLMPIDECPYQASLPIGTTIVDGLDNDKYLFVDSISDPRKLVSAELYGSPFSSSPYQGAWQARSPGEIFWQAKKDQRLWTLPLNENAISSGGSGEYYIIFHTIYTAQAWKMDRYKSLRGEE